MLLPAAACEIIDTWTVGGLRGTGSHDVVVRDLFVPIGYGSGFADPYILPEPRYRIPPFSRVIPGLGAMALGIARTAIETLGEIAGAKTPRARPRCSAIRPMPRFARPSRVARALRPAISVRQPQSAVAHPDRDRRGHDGGARACSAGGDPCRSSAVQAVDLMYVAGGASSLYTGCLLERAFRDVHAMTQHIGVHPRVMQTTGRVLFGLEPDTPLL